MIFMCVQHVAVMARICWRCCEGMGWPQVKASKRYAKGLCEG